MAVKRYALLDKEGRCVNTILLDREKNPTWTPPDGHTIEDNDKKEKDPTVVAKLDTPRTTQVFKTPPPLGEGKGL